MGSAALRFDSPESATCASFGDREIRLQELVLRVVGQACTTARPRPSLPMSARLTSRPERPTSLKQKDKLLSAKSAVLTLSNSPIEDAK